jgi:MOSC domain-containing protein YiiM
MPEPRIFQINASQGGVPKLALPQAEVTTTGLTVDRQAHPEVHGGPERALCLYALERILALQEEGHPIYPGATGENLTLVGLDWETLAPGARLRLGDEVEIELTRHTAPCSLIAACFADGDSRRIEQERHPGWSRFYARVRREGSLRVGDRVELL